VIFLYSTLKYKRNYVLHKWTYLFFYYDPFIFKFAILVILIFCHTKKNHSYFLNIRNLCPRFGYQLLTKCSFRRKIIHVRFKLNAVFLWFLVWIDSDCDFTFGLVRIQTPLIPISIIDDVDATLYNVILIWQGDI
jgi:hypothetical protein